MTINNERLFHFANPNGCWHEDEGELVCLKCGFKRHNLHEKWNPSYSTSPDDRERLWRYLMGKEEMWDEFFLYELSYGEYRKPIPWTQFIVWLFSPLDGVPRWVSLLSDWLGLEETREKFGWIDCPKDEPIEIDDGDCKYMACKNATEYCTCDGSGKVRAEWAKEG